MHDCREYDKYNYKACTYCKQGTHQDEECKTKRVSYAPDLKLKKEGPKNKLHEIHHANNIIGKSEPVVTFPELNNMETELQINSTRFPRPRKNEKIHTSRKINATTWIICITS